MIRILVLLLLIYVLWSLFRRRTVKKSSPKKELGTGEMVACASCGTFVLKSEAVLKGGKTYCSEKCKEQK